MPMTPRAVVLVSASAVAALVLTLLAVFSFGSPAVADGPVTHARAGAAQRAPIDLSGVTVRNGRKALKVRFHYRQRATSATPEDPYPYWWGATIYFDTDPRTPIPDYAAWLTNQCGSGYTIGKVVRRRDPATGDTWLTVTDKWQGGCGPAESCVHTATVDYGPDALSLGSITFRRKRGCFDARRVRVSALFRTGPYGVTSSDDDWSQAYDQADLFPRSSLTSYSPWTRLGKTRRFTDRSAGFRDLSPSQAP